MSDRRLGLLGWMAVAWVVVTVLAFVGYVGLWIVTHARPGAWVTIVLFAVVALNFLAGWYLTRHGLAEWLIRHGAVSQPAPEPTGFVRATAQCSGAVGRSVSRLRTMSVRLYPEQVRVELTGSDRIVVIMGHEIQTVHVSGSTLTIDHAGMRSRSPLVLHLTGEDLQRFQLALEQIRKDNPTVDQAT